jgi:hypothetical protein
MLKPESKIEGYKTEDFDNECGTISCFKTHGEKSKTVIYCLPNNFHQIQIKSSAISKQLDSNPLLKTEYAFVSYS